MQKALSLSVYLPCTDMCSARFPKLSLDLYYTEDEIYELSYTREPKNCKAPVSDRIALYVKSRLPAGF